MRILFSILFSLSCLMLQAGQLNGVIPEDTLLLKKKTDYYARKISDLYARCMCEDVAQGRNLSYSPYYYKVLSPALLYRSAIAQAFEIRYALPDTLADERAGKTYIDATDERVYLDYVINELLMRVYRKTPGLIAHTEDQTREAGVIQQDVNSRMNHESTLMDQTELQEMIPEVEDSIVVIPKKPNFWKYYSNSSLQFYQYYNSKNWYKDRTDNYYNMLGSLKMGVSYNNKSKFNWEMNLEMRLGFRPYPKDTEHQFKTSEDLIRLNTKIGYRATEHWNYTLFTEGTTQMLRSYYDNSDKVRSAFMTPFSNVVSLGMEYRLQLKRFNCTANLSPVAYNFKSVSRPELATQHGIKEGQTTYHKFGPFIKIDYRWNIFDNISWGARVYWFSDLTMNVIEWENTFTFNINKYITTQLFLYPRFDDSSPNYRSPKNNKYIMFKQWLSMGLTYNI